MATPFAFLALAAALLPQGTPPLPEPHLAAFAPPRTVAWLGTTDHRALLAEGLEHPLVAGFLALPSVARDLDRPPDEWLAAGEALLGADPLALLRDLCAEGLAVGASVTRGEPHAFAVLRGSDADRFDEALEALVDALGTVGLVEPLAADVAERLGVEAGWSAAGAGLSLGRVGERTLVVAQRGRGMIECVRASAAWSENPRMAAHRALHAAPGTGTFGWLDLGAIEAGKPLTDLRAAELDPATHVLLGPALTHFAGATEVSATFTFARESVAAELAATGPGRPAAAPTFPGGRSEPTPDVARHVDVARAEDEVARLLLHRDFDALLDRRAELFTPTALPELAEGVANLALITGGTGAIEDLLAALSPSLTIVVEEVDFGPTPRPDVPLPAACLVARIDDPETNGPRLVRAFQSAVVLQNIERSQNGRTGLLLDLELLPDGVTLNRAALPPPPDGASVDLAHNYAPGCWIKDDVLVLGTHHRAVVEVAARLTSEPRGAPPRALADDIELDGRTLARALAANRELLVTRAILLEGKRRQRAEDEVDTLQRIAGHLGSIRVRTEGSIAPERRLSARLTIELLPR